MFFSQFKGELKNVPGTIVQYVKKHYFFQHTASSFSPEVLLLVGIGGGTRAPFSAPFSATLTRVGSAGAKLAKLAKLGLFEFGICGGGLPLPSFFSSPDDNPTASTGTTNRPTATFNASTVSTVSTFSTF
jgi:hypothetical protein